VVSALDSALTERASLQADLEEFSPNPSTLASSLVVQQLTESKLKRVTELDTLVEALRDEYHRYFTTFSFC
jgi:hypothetical protein